MSFLLTFNYLGRGEGNLLSGALEARGLHGRLAAHWATGSVPGLEDVVLGTPRAAPSDARRTVWCPGWNLEPVPAGFP